MWNSNTAKCKTAYLDFEKRVLLFEDLQSIFFFLIAFNNSCSNTNVTLVSCGSYNSTKDHCLGLGCCWNSSSAVHDTQCYRVVKNNQTTSNETKTTNTPISTVLSTDVKTTATSLATSAR